MSSGAVITVENLGKRYRICHQQQGGMRYKALRDVLADKTNGMVRRLWTAFRRPPTSVLRPPVSEDFWALKDVSFEVEAGETLGIIGGNGAGKSTLLKILSRITEPTEGHVRIKGRVASLLEVGTGFHPELTGRENIFLNGAILGMTRAEIKKKFDEIVAFAEVQKFLDTPVKRYSSGMYVRLAFAVAAHLDPEILIVDEVLAVGDAQFQKKCLGKMEDVSRRHGRTVLFVSHNLPALRALCTSGLLLNEGRVDLVGAVDLAIDRYNSHSKSTNRLESRRISVEMNVEPVAIGGAQSAIVVRLVTELRGPLRNPHVGYGLNSCDGTRLTTLLTETSRVLPSLNHGQVYRFELRSEPVRLVPGHVSLKVALAEDGVDVEVFEDAIEAVIPDYKAFTLSPRTPPRGLIYLGHTITEYEQNTSQTI